MYNEHEYWVKVVDMIFRLLPLYEGRDKDTKDIIYNPEEAYINFTNNVTTVTLELEGFCADQTDPEVCMGLHQLINLIRGMKQLKIGEHNEVRAAIFSAIRKAKKLGGLN